jgi:ferric-dicitrate binding protein FerR (iron transport regulator)
MLLWLLTIFCFATIGTQGFPAEAEAAEAPPHIASWRVLEVAGSARYRVPAGISWSQAELGQALPPGSRIITEEDGTLTIERSGETITMKPNARLMLPPDYRTQRARQEVGGLSYHVDRTRGRRFEVETPYAALVVKGTAFDVDVTADGMAVAVERGLVEVTSRDGATADLTPGDAAKVGSSAPRCARGSPWLRRHLRAGRAGRSELVRPLPQ